MLPQSQGKTDGKWSEWGDWEPCSSSCGNGHHTQRRECLFDNPDCKGAPCSGSVTNVESCKGAHPNCRFLSPEKMLVHANLFININVFTFSGYRDVEDYMGECRASAIAGVWRLHCSWQLFIFLSCQVFGATIAQLLAWQHFDGGRESGIAATAVTMTLTMTLTMAGALKAPRG